MKDSFRFSRDRRFGKVDFAQFLESARVMTALVLCTNPSAEIEVLTSEDFRTYRAAVSSFPSDEEDDPLKDQKSYPLCEFTPAVWEKVFYVSLVCRDEHNPTPFFMVCLDCDRHREAGRLGFYGQSVGKELYDKTMETFHSANLLWSIGDGFGRVSDGDDRRARNSSAPHFFTECGAYFFVRFFFWLSPLPMR